MKSIDDVLSRRRHTADSAVETEVLKQVLSAHYARRGLMAVPVLGLILRLEHRLRATLRVRIEGNESGKGYTALVSMAGELMAVVKADGRKKISTHFVSTEALAQFIHAAEDEQAQFAQEAECLPVETPRYSSPRRNWWYADGKSVYIQPMHGATYLSMDIMRKAAKTGLCFALSDGKALRVSEVVSLTGQLVTVRTEQGYENSYKFFESTYHLSQVFVFDGDLDSLRECLPEGKSLLQLAQEFAARGPEWTILKVSNLEGVGSVLKVEQTLPGNAINTEYDVWVDGSDAPARFAAFLGKTNMGYFAAEAIQAELQAIWVVDTPVTALQAAASLADVTWK